MFNIASLIFGVCAWIFAGGGILSHKTSVSHRNTFISFCFCVISLIFQLFEINRRVLLGDYGAIEDTIRAVLIASVVMASVTVMLNVIAIVKAKNK